MTLSVKSRLKSQYIYIYVCVCECECECECECVCVCVCVCILHCPYFTPEELSARPWCWKPSIILFSRIVPVHPLVINTDSVVKWVIYFNMVMDWFIHSCSNQLSRHSILQNFFLFDFWFWDCVIWRFFSPHNGLPSMYWQGSTRFSY